MQISRRDSLPGDATGNLPSGFAQGAPTEIGVDLCRIRLDDWTPYQYRSSLSKANVQAAHSSPVRESSPMVLKELAPRQVRPAVGGVRRRRCGPAQEKTNDR